MELYLGLGLVLLLVGLAGVLAWRQWLLGRWLRNQEQLRPEEKAHFRGRLFRRWLGVGLLVILAVQMGGLFGRNILADLDRLVDKGPAAKAAGLKLTPAEEAFVRATMSYIGGMALVLLALLALALWDALAVRRWGNMLMRRLRADRQAMMERQFPHLYDDLSRRFEPKRFADD
jgi:di/tricarboxylate transporter